MYLYGHGGGGGMYVWRMPKLVGEEAYVFKTNIAHRRPR